MLLLLVGALSSSVGSSGSSGACTTWWALMGMKTRRNALSAALNHPTLVVPFSDTFSCRLLLTLLLLLAPSLVCLQQSMFDTVGFADSCTSCALRCCF
jgi:hypothetical protein